MTKCKYCGAESCKVEETIIVEDVEYETKTHDFDKKLSDIMIPKGWRLWTAEECIKLHNNREHQDKLNLADCWFFIKQPFAQNFLKGSVAWFGADSGRAFLYCVRDPRVSNSALGVRFCRDVSKSKKENGTQ